MKALSKEVEGLMKTVPGVVDLYAEQQIDVPTQKVHFRRDVIARYGLNIEQLTSLLKSAYQGEEVGVIFEDKMSYDIVLKTSDNERLGAFIGALPIISFSIVIWLYVETKDTQKIAEYSTYTFCVRNTNSTSISVITLALSKKYKFLDLPFNKFSGLLKLICFSFFNS